MSPVQRAFIFASSLQQIRRPSLASLAKGAAVFKQGDYVIPGWMDLTYKHLASKKMFHLGSSGTDCDFCHEVSVVLSGSEHARLTSRVEILYVSLFA